MRIKSIFATLLLVSFGLSAFAGGHKSGEPGAPMQTLFTNVHVFDGINEQRIENANVLVSGNLIVEVSSQPLAAANARVVGT